MVGVFALKPLNVIHAWFASFGSTKIAVGYRAGVAPAEGSLSIRSKTTVAGFAAFAFVETNTRPPLVAAQSVEVFDGARSTTAV